MKNLGCSEVFILYLSMYPFLGCIWLFKFLVYRGTLYCPNPPKNLTSPFFSPRLSVYWLFTSIVIFAPSSSGLFCLSLFLKNALEIATFLPWDLKLRWNQCRSLLWSFRQLPNWSKLMDSVLREQGLYTSYETKDPESYTGKHSCCLQIAVNVEAGQEQSM